MARGTKVAVAQWSARSWATVHWIVIEASGPDYFKVFDGGVNSRWLRYDEEMREWSTLEHETAFRAALAL